MVCSLFQILSPNKQKWYFISVCVHLEMILFFIFQKVLHPESNKLLHQYYVSTHITTEGYTD